MILTNCPICLGRHLNPAKFTPVPAGCHVDCPACGLFDISDLAWDDYLDPQTGAGQKFPEIARARLSHRCRVASDTSALGRLKIDSEAIVRFIEGGFPGPNPAEQATNLIRFIGTRVRNSGHKIGLPNHLYTVIGADSPVLASEIARELYAVGDISGITSSEIGRPWTLLDANLTLKGWQKYQDQEQGRAAGNFGFLAMRFGDPILDPFVANIIKPAVKDGINYDLVDMRDVSRAGVIDNIMRAQIRDSAFVIVDLTHDNSGAYWEAGYAEGLGKPVIYICEVDKFAAAQTHFDTNHCTTVMWSVARSEQFAKELVATLRRSLDLFK